MTERAEGWLVALRDLVKTTDHRHTVVRQPCAGSWLFTTGPQIRWAVDPLPVPDWAPATEAVIVGGLRELDFCLLTHIGNDRRTLQFLKRIASDSRVRWILPEPMTAFFSRETTAAPERLIGLRERESVEIRGIRVSRLSDGAFRLELPDRVSLRFPALSDGGESSQPGKKRNKEFSPAAIDPSALRWPGSAVVLEDKPLPDHYAMWTPEQRGEFDSFLGCAIKGDVLNQLEQAVVDRIPAVELNANTLEPLDRAVLAGRVAEWRTSGGRLLSMHMTAIPVSVAADFSRDLASIALVLELGCDRVTEHVPACTVAHMREHRNQVLENFIRVLSPFMERGVAIGIENMHMTAGTPEDERRGFGFTIPEWLEFIELLRERAGYRKIGCHVDIGHAYANYPFHPAHTVETWLRAGGALINGVHIHQFDRDRSESTPYPKGHFHISGRNAGYPRLEPLYRLWGERVFRAPMFLEICRGPEAEPFPSRRRLTAL